MRIIISGNSNCGKTTLFNALTGLDAHTGNWLGVTTKAEIGTFDYKGEKVEIIDLPGTFSNSTFTLEEKNAVEYLEKGDYDVIINVIEAARLKDSAILTEKLARLKKPMVLFLNFAKELVESGGKIDCEALERLVGVKNILGEVTNKKDVQKLLELVFSAKALPNSFSKNDVAKLIQTSAYSMPKLDKFLFKSITAFPFYFVIVAITFYMAFGRFGLGNILGGFLNALFAFFSKKLNLVFSFYNVNAFVGGIFTDGILKGFASVAVFIPQLIVLQICLAILEQSGLIARLSFVCDGFLSKLGLNGRAVFSLLMGFGCSTVALETARGIENKTMESRLVKSIPFVSCSARVPIYLFVAKIAFQKITALALVLIYLTSAFLTIMFLAVQSKISKDKTAPLVLEVPPLRKIKISTMLKSLKKIVKEFIIKLSTVVLIVSIIIYILKSFSTDFRFITESQVESSLLAFIGSKFAFLFNPLGLGDWRVSTALLCGIFTKESVVSTFSLLFPSGILFGKAQAAALLIFVIVYTPCVVALDAMRREVGFKSMFVSAIFQFVLALFLAYLSFWIFVSKIAKAILIVLICLVLCIKFVKITLRKRFENENNYRKAKGKSV